MDAIEVPLGQVVDRPIRPEQEHRDADEEQAACVVGCRYAGALRMATAGDQVRRGQRAQDHPDVDVRAERRKHRRYLANALSSSNTTRNRMPAPDAPMMKNRE